MADERENSTGSAPLERPSDAQVDAFISGSEVQQVEQSGAQAPATPTGEQAPGTSAPTASQPDIAALVREVLKAELNPIQSELGQVRKMRSAFDRMQAQQNQPVTPQSWAQMKPEEQSQVLELVEHAWKQKYGSQWEAMNQRFEVMQQRESLSQVENLARELAGEQFSELDPIMGNIYSDLTKKAESGDRQAQRLVYEIANTYSGVSHLVNLAKAELAQSVKANEEKAKADRQQAAKRAGSPIQSAPAAQNDEAFGPNFKNLPVAEMRKRLAEAGVL